MKSFSLFLIPLTLLFLVHKKTNAQSPNWEWTLLMDGIYEGYNSMTVDANGNVYTTGQFSGTIDFDPGTGIFNLTSAGVANLFISKFNSSGNFVWAKAMTGTQSMGGSIALDAVGNVYTTGFFLVQLTLILELEYII